jgi:hypothetical protein
MEVVHSGSKALEVSGRTASWAGPHQNIKAILEAAGQGTTFAVSAWMRTQNPAGAQAKFTIYINAGTGVVYLPASQPQGVNNGGYSQISGLVTVSWAEPLLDARIYIETNEAAGFFVDDVSMVEPAPAPPPPDLLTNGDMESGVDPWNCNWNCVLSSETTIVHGGTASLEVANRTASWAGPHQTITSALNSLGSGATVEASAWVRTTNSGGAQAKLTVYLNSASGVQYIPLSAFQAIFPTAFTEVSGTATLSWQAPLNEARIYLETNESADFLVDDFHLLPATP